MNYAPSVEKTDYATGILTTLLLSIVVYFTLGPFVGFGITNIFWNYYQPDGFPVDTGTFILYRMYASLGFMSAYNSDIAASVQWCNNFESADGGFWFNVYNYTIYIVTIITAATVSKISFNKTNNEFITSGFNVIKDHKISFNFLKKEMKRACKINGQKRGVMIHPGTKKNHSDAIYLPFAAEQYSFLYAGSIGAGKTQGLQWPMQSAIARGDLVFIFDFKGDFTESVEAWMPEGEKPAYFAPWDVRTSTWDIRADMSNITDPESIAHNLIPKPPGVSDEYWVNAARDVMAAVLMALNDQIPSWSVRDLAAIFSSLTMVKQCIAEYRPGAIVHVEGDGGQSQGVVGALRETGQSLDTWSQLQGGKRFSLKKWVHGQTKQKVIIANGNYKMKFHYPVIASMISAIIAEAITLPENQNRRIFLFLDEVAILPAIDLAAALTTGRSKGLVTCLGLQTSAQMEHTYDKLSDVIIGQIGNKIIGKLNDPKSAKWASEMFGEQEIERFSATHQAGGQQQTGDIDAAFGIGGNASTSWQNREKSAITAGEFMTMPDPRAIGGPEMWCKFQGIDSHVLKIRWPFTPTPKVAKPYIYKKNISMKMKQKRAASLLEATPAPEVKPSNAPIDNNKETEPTEVIEQQPIFESKTVKEESVEESETLTLEAVQDGLLDELTSMANDEDKNIGDEVLEQGVGEMAEMALGGGIGLDVADHAAELMDGFEEGISKRNTKTISGHKTGKKRKTKKI